MRTSLRSIVVLFVLVASLAGCSNDDSDGGETQGGPVGGETGIDDIDVAAEDEAAVEIARTYLESEAGIDAETASQLVLHDVQTAREVKHVTFDQAYDGHTVDGAAIVVHVVGDEVQGTSDTLTTARPDEGAGLSIDEAEAVDTASKAIEGEVASAEAVQAWVEDGDVLHLSWLVTLEATDPVGSWSVIVDGADGSVVSTDAFRPERREPNRKYTIVPADEVVAQTPRGEGDACEAPEAPSACIFLGDPIYASGGLLDDRREVRDANDHLVGVELQGLDDPESGRLVGEFVDTETDLSSVEPVVEQDGIWAQGRGAPGFEAAMAYYWFDYAQRAIQDMGFEDIRNESFAVVPVDPATVDNAYYSPYDQAVFLGVGSDGINEAEDAAGMTHEYGHAVLDDIAPSLIGDGEAGAYHEGFGDVFAFLTLLEYRTGVGELDAGCLFAWTEEMNCLRRVDEDLVYPDDREFGVHQDGRIWSGAIWDVLDALLVEAGLDGVADCPGATGDTLATCDEVRDRVLATNLAANYYLTSGMTLPDAAEAFMLANESNFDGADEDLLTDAFARHGLGDGGDIVRPEDDPEPEPDARGVAVSVDVEHSYRGDLDIDLTVVDDAGEERCATSLFESDIHDSGDNFQAIVGLEDSGCEELVPPGPDQRWVLTVADQMPEDVGTILDFSVLANDTEYRAGNVPLPIPDDSRAGVAAVVAGVDGEGPTTGVVEGQPFLSYAITHTYVGDLQAAVEVTDSKGDVLCAVPVLEPDASNDGDGVDAEVDVSACADFLPPSDEQTWTVVIRDTAELDVGTVDALTLDDGDGNVYELPEAPVDIPDLPDAESGGTRLILEGGASDQGGGDGPTTMHVEVTHPYRGDLSISAGVTDAAGDVLCEEIGATPDADDAASDLTVDIDLTSCASRHGFGPEVTWFVQVSDTLAEDEGALTVAELTLPDGSVATSADDASLPLDLPDADTEGVLLVFPVSAPATAGAASMSLEISHPYAGDLDVAVRALDDAGDEVCSVLGHEPDPLDDTDGLVLAVDLSNCFAEIGGTGVTWELVVADVLEVDEGEVVSATLVLPDGTVLEPAEALPVAIPDHDPDGIVVTFGG